jgi:branched-chain amino acid transport system permease protein
MGERFYHTLGWILLASFVGVLTYLCTLNPTKFLELSLYGLVLGSIYALVALGFALIYKSTSILNLAQGEFLMVGAYICLSLILQFQIHFIWAFFITLLFSVFLGLAVERLVLRPLIGEPIISVIMVTIALSSILKGMVIMFWGNDIRPFPKDIPFLAGKPFPVFGVPMAPIYIWSFGLAIFFLLLFAIFFKLSRTGIAMRATASNQQVSQSMGISVKKVFAISWCVAAVVSSVGGIILGYISGVGITLSFFGLKVFPAVILGGLDSILGAIIGGVTIGLLENYSGGYLDHIIPAVKEVFPFVVLVIILFIKPYGLFGKEEIERV